MRSSTLVVWHSAHLMTNSSECKCFAQFAFRCGLKQTESGSDCSNPPIALPLCDQCLRPCGPAQLYMVALQVAVLYNAHVPNRSANLSFVAIYWYNLTLCSQIGLHGILLAKQLLYLLLCSMIGVCPCFSCFKQLGLDLVLCFSIVLQMSEAAEKRKCSLLWLLCSTSMLCCPRHMLICLQRYILFHFQRCSI